MAERLICVNCKEYLDQCVCVEDDKTGYCPYCESEDCDCEVEDY